MKQLNFEGAPQINAHYSPAVVANEGKTVYISGQLPINPVTREKSTGDIKAQTTIALNNIEKILQTAGGNRKNIVRTTAYIDNILNWDAVNKAYTEYFGEQKPARTIVSVREIHFGMLVEIEAIAVI